MDGVDKMVLEANSPDFEDLKHKESRAEFFRGFEEMMKMDIPKEDLVHFFPALTGKENLARFLALYELYKKAMGVLGHVAEIGIWRGASFLYLAKLVQLFEPHSLTQVHGFDWFKGMRMSSEHDDNRYEEEYRGDFEQLKCLIELQKLDTIAFIRNMDVTIQLSKFLEVHTSLQFKLVFLDCGIYDVVRATLNAIWPWVSCGGILIFARVNLSSVRAETIAIREFFGDNIPLKTLPFSGWPSGYLVKGCSPCSRMDESFP